MIEDVSNGLAREIGLGNFGDDEAGDGGFAERYEDNGAGREFLVELVSQNVSASAEDFGGGDFVEIHDSIIYERRGCECRDRSEVGGGGL